MRILQIINTLDIGGAEVLVTHLVPRMRQRNLDVEVAVLQLTGSRLEQQILNAGINLFAVGADGVYSPLNVLRLAALPKRDRQLSQPSTTLPIGAERFALAGWIAGCTAGIRQFPVSARAP